ncbi:MAG: hypothetical protein AAGA09_01265 [Pseudomonadota bacterium]
MFAVSPMRIMKGIGAALEDRTGNAAHPETVLLVGGAAAGRAFMRFFCSARSCGGASGDGFYVLEIYM